MNDLTKELPTRESCMIRTIEHTCLGGLGRKEEPIKSSIELKKILLCVRKVSEGYSYYFSIITPNRRFDCEIKCGGSFAGTPMYMFSNYVTLFFEVNGKKGEIDLIMGRKKKIPSDRLEYVISLFENEFLINGGNTSKV